VTAAAVTCVCHAFVPLAVVTDSNHGLLLCEMTTEALMNVNCGLLPHEVTTAVMNAIHVHALVK
jgi:hypothetical protein